MRTNEIRAPCARVHAREEHGRAMLLRIERASGHGREHCESCESEGSCYAGSGGFGRRARATSVTGARGRTEGKGRSAEATATGATENALGVCSPRVPCIVPAPKINGPVRFVSPSSFDGRDPVTVSLRLDADAFFPRPNSLVRPNRRHAAHLDPSSQSAVWCLPAHPPPPFSSNGGHPRVVPRANGPP